MLNIATEASTSWKYMSLSWMPLLTFSLVTDFLRVFSAHMHIDFCHDFSVSVEMIV